MVGILIAAAFINYAIYKLTGYPLLYCMGLMAVQPILQWIESVMVIMALSAPVAHLIGGPGWSRPLVGTWLTFGIFPGILYICFGFGHTCGISQVVPKAAAIVSRPADPIKASVAKPATVEPLTGGVLWPEPKECRPDKVSVKVAAEKPVPPLSLAPPKMSERERGLMNRELY